jgi:hypothetical protein
MDLANQEYTTPLKSLLGKLKKCCPKVLLYWCLYTYLETMTLNSEGLLFI